MDETPYAARLVTALAATWAGIRARHPDAPPVMITLGAGSIGMRPGELKLGHFAAGRWEHPCGLLAELFVGGEGTAEMEGLAGALTAWRRSESQALTAGPGGGGEGQDDDGDSGGGEGGGRRGGGRKSSNNGVAARCGCQPPRRIRVSPAVLDAGPITCGLCGADFAPPDPGAAAA